MIEPPETRYTRSAGLSIAYQVFGQGQHTFVVTPAILGHVEAPWSIPVWARYYMRLAAFVQMVRFDRRGMGLSDRLAPEVVPSLQERAEDLVAVLDAIGVEKAVIFGAGDGAHVALQTAAAFPARVESLILYGTWACLRASAGYPLGRSDENLERLLALMGQQWGSDSAPFGLDFICPSMRDDPQWRHSLARLQRIAASPAAAVAFHRESFSNDMRAILPKIEAPTLVLHKSGDQVIPIENARYLAAHLPDARLVELPGVDHAWLFTECQEQAINAMKQFITGRTPHIEPDRSVASILFTDIVESTSTAVSMGNERWTDLMLEHEEAVRREVSLHGGRVVDTAGDGVFAIFSMPRLAIQCALRIQEAMRALNLQVRAGIHSGEVESREGRIGGVAVHIGARIAAAAQPNEILVSRTVRDLVTGSGIPFSERGSHELKGLSEPWQLFAVGQVAN